MKILLYDDGEEYKRSLFIKKEELYSYYHLRLDRVTSITIHPNARGYYNFKELKVVRVL